MEEGIIFEGKSVEQAINSAIKKMKCSKEDIEIEIIQQPVKGIFGIAKVAKVKINRKNIEPKNEKTDDEVYETEPTRKEGTNENMASIDIDEKTENDQISELASKGKAILSDIIMHMGINKPRIKVKEEEGTIYLDVQSEAEGLLIGRHGQTLTSLQYLLNRIIINPEIEKIRFIVDVGSYRIRHKMILEKMAKRIAKKVIENKEEQELQAMSAFDRRIIHLCMKDNPLVTTYSLGEGNLRRIVIAPKSQDNSVKETE